MKTIHDGIHVMHAPTPNFSAIVLAAGMSTRMGPPKLLLPFGDATVLDGVLRNFAGVAGVLDIVVVTGHRREDVSHVVFRHATAREAYNPCFAEGGMISSVQVGVSALPEDADAFLLALGDQPLVRPDTIALLVEAWRRSAADIVTATYDGRRGHPVLFSSACVSEILALPADATLKEYMASNVQNTLAVAVSDRFILTDIDTPQDYADALAARAEAGASRPAPGDPSYA